MSSETPFSTIKLKSMAFGLDLHPSRPLLAAGLISGQLKLYEFERGNGDGDGDGNGSEAAASTAGSVQQTSSARPHKDTCRAVLFSKDGQTVFTTGVDGTLQQRDVDSNKPAWRRRNAAPVAINALTLLGDVGVATGDEDGTVRCWDLRTHKPALKFSENDDYIASMLYTDARKGNTLAVAGGDGHLSVFDLRAGRLWARSDNQEDELLSLSLLKSGRKLVCGMQTGTVGIFSWGDFGDISDRCLGHPSAVDCMVAHGEDHLLTGSSDGLIRMVGIHPNQVLGVVGAHEEDTTIEQLAMDAAGEVLASCGHDETIRLWDVAYLNDRDDSDEDEDDDDNNGDSEGGGAAKAGARGGGDVEAAAAAEDASAAGTEAKQVAKAAKKGARAAAATMEESEDDSDEESSDDDAEDEDERRGKKRRVTPIVKRNAAIKLSSAFFSGL